MSKNGEAQGQRNETAETKVQASIRRTKVAIVGFASHWNRAPFEAEDTEIWALNELYDICPWQKARDEGRLRWFEIHSRSVRNESNPFVDFVHSRNNDHAQKLAALAPAPVYMQQHWDDIPNSVEYPLQAMIERFGNYFTNSISYMLALAIAEGFKEIHVYGVDMAQSTEYASQRPSCEYFIGIIKALGIKFYLPPESDLLKTSYLYGWEQPKIDVLRAKLTARIDELQKRLDHNLNQRAQLEAAINQLRGAIEDCRYVMGVWT